MGDITNLRRGTLLRGTIIGAGMVLLSACSEGRMPGFLGGSGGSDGDETVSRAAGGAAAERDIEAPEIFQVSEAGLWDGRPSLGGVWVAHPEVEEPGRVIIRNEQNGQFVIGALFRRERETPGPRLQVSSDAAAAIGMLAGQPTNLDVVALKRQEGPVGEEAALPAATAEAGAEATVPEAATVESASLDPVAGAAGAALDAADAPETATPAPAAPVAAAAPTPSGSGLDKPFIQVGIFSVEENARNTATAMRQAGMVPTVKKQSLSGKPYWRVVVGPAQTSAERATLLDTIQGTGFSDAYAVDS